MMAHKGHLDLPVPRVNRAVPVLEEMLVSLADLDHPDLLDLQVAMVSQEPLDLRVTTAVTEHEVSRDHVDHQDPRDHLDLPDLLAVVVPEATLEHKVPVVHPGPPARQVMTAKTDYKVHKVHPVCLARTPNIVPAQHEPEERRPRKHKPNNNRPSQSCSEDHDYQWRNETWLHEKNIPIPKFILIISNIYLWSSKLKNLNMFNH
jgi:hypothetical protein